MLWVALVFQFLSVSLFRGRRKKAFCLIRGFFAHYWCCKYTAALQRTTYLGMVYSLKLSAVQVQGHRQWVPDGLLPSCLFAAKTLPAWEKEGLEGKLGAVTWLPSCCLLLGHHCWLESLTITQVSKALHHWANLKISINSLIEITFKCMQVTLLSSKSRPTVADCPVSQIWYGSAFWHL